MGDVVLPPSDDRFGRNALGAVERFRAPFPLLDTPEYKPAEGMGRNVGVDGREDGVGIDMVDAVVLALALLSVFTVSRADVDCERFMPLAESFPGRTFVLCPSELSPAFNVDEEVIGRKDAARSDGLSERRISRPAFSLTFAGEGESSMMSTHPLVSPAAADCRFSAFTSALCLFIECGSSNELFREEELAERWDAILARFSDGTGGGGVGTAAGRPPVTLPMRNRGTLVWIFCSRFFTRARISVTICTPLLFATGAGVLFFPCGVMLVRLAKLARGIAAGVRLSLPTGAVVERMSDAGLLPLEPDELGRDED